MVQKIEQIPGVGIQSYLGSLGMPGMTAYAGLLRIAEFKPEDSVFVSGPRALSARSSARSQSQGRRRGRLRPVGRKCAYLKEIAAMRRSTTRPAAT